MQDLVSAQQGGSKNNSGHLVIKKVNKLDRNESLLDDFYSSDFFKPKTF